jgi:signal transduction histidine kinase
MMSNIEKLSEGIGIEIMAADGTRVYRSPLFDSKTPVGPPFEAPIVIDNSLVGTVSTSVFSDAAPRNSTSLIRVNTYIALLVAGLIAAVLAALAGVFFARHFVRPLEHITEVSREVGSGNLAARTRMEGNDELSRLGRAVDEMISAVEKNKRLERQITTDVAHELRTPLMAMQATIEAMIDGILPADSTRLATLNSEVVRLGRLVDIQLELSWLESGKTVLRIEDVDLSRLVEDLVATHEMFIEDAGLDLEYRITPDIIVPGDADLLRQAVSNLLSNAVRYTPAGGKITIQVGTQHNHAQVFVSDTGIGIAEEDLEHVFARFWRANPSRDRESGGLGVGLAMVREIVSRHHGLVNAESKLGVGTTFTISLPLLAEGVGKVDYNEADDNEADDGGGAD